MFGLPNVLRIILLAASLAAFAPQIRRIIQYRSCSGLAPTYVLFNLIGATQQFAVHLHFMVAYDDVIDENVASPPTFGNWLNMAQLTTVWLAELVLFSLCLYFPPIPSSTKKIIVALYLIFTTVVIAPVLLEATMPPTGTDGYDDRRWIAVFIAALHYFGLTTLATALITAAYIPELLMIQSRAPIDALSPLGLITRALVFVVLGSTWPMRMLKPLDDFVLWYQLAGWATVNSLIYASVQALLFVAILGRGGEGGAETMALLR